VNNPKPSPPARRFPIWLFIGLFAIFDLLAFPVIVYGMVQVGPSMLFIPYAV
jgi:hypothetical protein